MIHPFHWNQPSDSIGEAHQWTGDDDRPMPSVPDERKARDWTSLAGEARAFRARYGAAALLRCIAGALDE